MNVKAVVNSKGEPQESRIEIAIEGGGGEQGIRAVKHLAGFIAMFKDMGSENEINAHLFAVYGYALCCMNCGFITKKSMEDLYEAAEHLRNEALAQVKGGGNHGK